MSRPLRRGLLVFMSLILLILLFEYLICPRVIPNYPRIRQVRIFSLIWGTAGFTAWKYLKKPGKGLMTAMLVLFMIVKVLEVHLYYPVIYRPDLTLSLFMTANFLGIYLILLTMGLYAPETASLTLLLSTLVYDTIYYLKLKNAPEIIILLVVITTLSLYTLALQLRSENQRKHEMEGLYHEERALKQKIALMRGKMMEQEKSFSLSMLTSGITHELGNPLNYLQGNIMFMEENLKSPDNTHEDDLYLMGQIKNGISEIEQIIGNMKSLYGHSKISRERVLLKELINRTVSFFRFSVKDVHYQLTVDIPSDLIITVVPGELHIVTFNLLSNALDAMVNAEERQIHIRGEHRDGKVHLRVSDTGTGITPEIKEKIFDPFFSSKKREGNIGLGLALCRDIVQEHRGTLTAEDNKPQGTIFHISLPETP